MVNKNVPNNCENTERDSEQDPKKAGKDYEGHVAMLLIVRAILNKFIFKIGVEIKQANKFDDVVYLREKQKRLYSKCIQIKHTIKNKKINSINLLSCDQDNFSMIKYFFSFKDSVKEDFFKDITQEDLILYTNFTINLESEIKKNIKISKAWSQFDTIEDLSDVKTIEDLLVPIKYNNDNIQDDIFNDKTGESHYYKFNKNIITILKSKANEYNVTRVVQALNDWFMGKRTLKEVKHILKPYWKFLTEEIIDVNVKGFRDSFLNNQRSKNITKESKFFFKKLIEEIQRKNIKNNKKSAAHKTCELTIPILNELAKKIDPYPNWKISNEKFDIKNIIKEEEIEAFLKLFILAVNQPNTQQLKKNIKADILIEQKNIYGHDDFYTDDDIDRYVDVIFNNFLKEVLSWKEIEDRRNIKIDKNEIIYITQKNSKSLLKNTWDDQKFGIQEPLKSFMGREDELESLHKKICRGESVTSQTNVVCGLAGMGKSELIREYVKIYSHRYENKIFWIDGKSTQSLENSFRNLAISINININTSEGKSKEIKTLVNEIYMQFTSKKCLFIFDDVHNKNIIDPFLPKDRDKNDNVGNLPFILITSVNSNWKSEITKTELGVLTEKNAIKLIEKQANINSITESNNIQKLVQILEYFPLAIQQVAAYIVKEFKKKSDFTIAQCLESFSENSESILQFPLQKNMSTYTKTTFTNFKNIIDSICEYETIGDNAFKVLGVMSFLDTNNIAMSWFSEYFTFDLNEVYELLKEYSAIRIKSGVMSIHSLVQLVTILILKQQEKEKHIIETTFELFCKIYPKGNTMADFAKKRMLKAHLNMFISHIDKKSNTCTAERKKSYLKKLLWMCSDCFNVLKEPKKRVKILSRLFVLVQKMYGENDLETAKVLMDVGVVESDLGNYKTAKDNFDKALIIFLINYGDDHTETADLWMKIGNVELCLRKCDSAKSHFQRALQIFEKNFGDEHQKTASALLGIGKIECANGNFEMAKMHFETVLNVYFKILEENHVETAEVMMKLGDVEFNLTNLFQARCLYLKVLGIFISYYGTDHLETANVLIELGNVEFELVNYSEAKTYFEKAYILYLNNCGKEDIRTIDLLMKLAIAQLEEGEYSKAKECFEKVLEERSKIYEKNNEKIIEVKMKLGEIELTLGNYESANSHYKSVLTLLLLNDGQNQERTADVHVNLGVVERNLGNYLVAKNYYENAYGVYLEHFGEDHQRSADVLMNLAVVDRHLGNYTVAKAHCEKVLASRLCQLKENNIKTAEVYMNLGIIKRNLGFYAEAKSHFEAVLPIYSKSFGEDHIRTASLINNIGVVERHLGNYEIGKENCNKALTAYVRFFGDHHLRTSATLLNLAVIERNLNDNNLAKRIFKKVKAIREKIYGENHLRMTDVLMNLGVVERNLGNYEVAKNHYEKVLSTRSQMYGDHHIQTADILSNLGVIENQLNNFKSAEIYYKKVLYIRLKEYGEDHIQTAHILKNLGNLEYKLRNYVEAESCYNKVLSVYSKFYGNHDFRTIQIIFLLCQIGRKLGNDVAMKSLRKKYYEYTKLFSNKNLLINSNDIIEK